MSQKCLTSDGALSYWRRRRLGSSSSSSDSGDSFDYSYSKWYQHKCSMESSSSSSSGSSSEEDDNCDCNGGMTSITMQYTGTCDATITGYYSGKDDETIICSPTAISTGDLVTCTAEPDYDKFKSNTYFGINCIDRRRRRMGDLDLADCTATFHTSCSQNILGEESEDCTDLTVIAYTSGDGAVCEDPIIDEENEFMTEVCIKYSVDGLVEDCGELTEIFLSLCENNKTDFNSSTINANDLTDLVVSIDPPELQYYGGRADDDELGIFINFTNEDVDEFELCLGNVTVDTHFNKNKGTVDVGDGVIYIENEESECNMDGLPCLNFFFDEPCPNTTETVFKNCDCDDGMTSITMEYTGVCSNATITGYYSDKDDDDSLSCSPSMIGTGDVVTCSAAPNYDKFKSNTYFGIVCNDDVDGDCTAKFHTSCSQVILGEESEDCGDLTVVSYSSGDGAICDETVHDGTSNNCDCDGGMTSLTMQYTGDC
eukprot:543615_1